MKLIILDRDGVINEDSDQYIKSVDEWIPISGSIEAISKLSKNNYKVIIITNQSGISRGFYDHKTLAAMHNKMCKLVTQFSGVINAIFYCPHGPADNCNCRKPKAGLFKRVEQVFDVSLENVYCIGDSYRDILAAKQCKGKPILVKTGKGELTLKEQKKNINFPVYKNLAQAVDAILSNHV